MPAVVVLGACCLALALIGIVDWVTGTELRVFPLYFMPITAVAWRMSRRYAFAAALAATAMWHVANALSADQAIAIPVQAVNLVTMFVAFAVIGVLVAELHARLRAEQASSRTDALTQLPNRRGFLERADVLVAAGARSDRRVTLAFIDLDHFKRVNDEHGHAAGDTALRTAADVLRRSLREGDVLGRLGGDELAALLPDATASDARTALDRLRTQIGKTMRDRGWPITASIGAVCFVASATTSDDALAAADAVMYEAKRAGKDRVHVIELAPGERLPDEPDRESTRLRR